MFDYCENDGVYSSKDPTCIICFYSDGCKIQKYIESGKKPDYGMHYLDRIEQVALPRKKQIKGIQDLSNHQ